MTVASSPCVPIRSHSLPRLMCRSSIVKILRGPEDRKKVERGFRPRWNWFFTDNGDETFVSLFLVSRFLITIIHISQLEKEKV